MSGIHPGFPPMGDDGQLFVQGLHDAHMLAISVADGIELTFETGLGQRLRLGICPAASPYLWGFGVVMPNIVSTAWLGPENPSQEWLSSRIGREAAAACQRERQIFAPDGWVLAVEMIAGGPIAAFGMHALSAADFWVELPEPVGSVRSLLIGYRVWEKCLQFGEHSGCRPGPEVMGLLKNIEAREQMKINDRAWVSYLLPDLKHIDERHASCLAPVLTAALDQLRDPSLGLRHAVNGAESPTLSKGGIHTEDIDGIERVRNWCLGGAFSVEWHRSHFILSR